MNGISSYIYLNILYIQCVDHKSVNKCAFNEPIHNKVKNKNNNQYTQTVNLKTLLTSTDVYGPLCIYDILYTKGD